MKYDDLPAILRGRLRPSSAAGWVAGFALAVGLLVGAAWLAAEVEPYVGTDWAAVVALGVMVAVPVGVALVDMPFERTEHGALLVQVPLRGFPLPDWIDRYGCPACGGQSDHARITPGEL